MACVYILKSLKNNSYYIGGTKDISRRIKEHLRGKSKYTKEIFPVILVFKQEYKLVKTAREVENWLKKQKDRRLIERIIREQRIVKNFV